MRAETQTTRVAPADEVPLILQAASLLLDYPQPEEAKDVELLLRAVAGLRPGEAKRRLTAFLDAWKEMTPRAREQAYVQTFDLNAKACLYLTARQRGDKRYRGRQLLRLRDEYRRHGLEATHEELPDYLPLMLEFAAHEADGLRLLQDERAALNDLRDCLHSLASPFADVLEAVLAVLDQRQGGLMS